MTKVIFHTQKPTHVTIVRVMPNNYVYISYAPSYDNAETHTISMSKKEALQISFCLLANFGDETSEIIKGLYENYLKNEKE